MYICKIMNFKKNLMYKTWIKFYISYTGVYHANIAANLTKLHSIDFNEN